MKAVLKKRPAAVAQKSAVSIVTLREALHAFLNQKEDVADALLCSLLSGGHVLFEDVPGVGKTTLIKSISKMLGLEMSRIQCTSDLLPSDILGVEVFSSRKEDFSFHKGPVFSNLVFVDELNRCSPRTQSALLEAMAEGVVTLNRTTYELPKPFVVFATQNPSDFVGTYPLPESQLDRFAVKLHLHYPSSPREKEIFQVASGDPLQQVASLNVGAPVLEQWQQQAEKVHISDRVVDYVHRLVDATRNHPSIRLGVSTRGGVTWIRMARAYALLMGRDYVIPDDLHALARACLVHRLVPRNGADAVAALQECLTSTPVEKNVP